MSVLFKKDEDDDFYKWSLGSTSLLTEVSENNKKLIICVKCSFGETKEKYYALFDTGAEWTVVPQSIVDSNADCFHSLDIPIKLTSRFGTSDGILHQCDLRILVDSGEDIIVDATVLVIPHWEGPVVLGFKSLLNKIRWACDPTIDNQGRLYFGLVE